MRALVGVVVLAALVASEPRVFRDYHNEIGIPEFERIKAAEEANQAKIASSNPDDRIVGGVIAPPNLHPYLAGLIISLQGTAGQSVCGSSLLSANRLVTAAHCWSHGSMQGTQFVVVLGTNNLFTGGTRIATSQVILHPLWNRFSNTLENDVAMIYLPTNVAFSPSIQPAVLPSGNQLWQDFSGFWANAAGFGKTSDQQQGASTSVSHINLQVITPAQCRLFWSVFVFPSTLCTNGAGGVGICGGDSGGPLVIQQNGQNLLIGISSFAGHPDNIGCQGGFPSGFARVTSFINFIQQHLF